MEELKILVGLIADLPALAIWVLLGFFAYKVICVGSVFGIVRVAILKIHDVLILKAYRGEENDLTGKIGGLVILGCLPAFMTQINRLAGIKTPIDTPYVHLGDIRWLKEAIDEKLGREKEKKCET